MEITKHTVHRPTSGTMRHVLHRHHDPDRAEDLLRIGSSGSPSSNSLRRSDSPNRSARDTSLKLSPTRVGDPTLSPKLHSTETKSDDPALTDLLELHEKYQQRQQKRRPSVSETFASPTYSSRRNDKKANKFGAPPAAVYTSASEPYAAMTSTEEFRGNKLFTSVGIVTCSFCPRPPPPRVKLTLVQPLFFLFTFFIHAGL